MWVKFVRSVQWAGEDRSAGDVLEVSERGFHILVRAYGDAEPYEPPSAPARPATVEHRDPVAQHRDPVGEPQKRKGK